MTVVENVVGDFTTHTDHITASSHSTFTEHNHIYLEHNIISNALGFNNNVQMGWQLSSACVQLCK